jgi:hypothetical protein
LLHAETVEAGRQDEWFDRPFTTPPYPVDRTRHLAPPLDGPGTGVVPTALLPRRAPVTARWSSPTRTWEQNL